MGILPDFVTCLYKRVIWICSQKKNLGKCVSILSGTYFIKVEMFPLQKDNIGVTHETELIHMFNFVAKIFNTIKIPAHLQTTSHDEELLQ